MSMQNEFNWFLKVWALDEPLQKLYGSDDLALWLTPMIAEEPGVNRKESPLAVRMKKGQSKRLYQIIRRDVHTGRMDVVEFQSENPRLIQFKLILLIYDIERSSNAVIDRLNAAIEEARERTTGYLIHHDWVRKLQAFQDYDFALAEKMPD